MHIDCKAHPSLSKLYIIFNHAFKMYETSKNNGLNFNKTESIRMYIEKKQVQIHDIVFCIHIQQGRKMIIHFSVIIVTMWYLK